MSERLSELSASVSLELNLWLQRSSGSIKSAQKIIESMRKQPPAQVDGIHLILDSIVELMEQADELHIKALKQVGDTYGHVRESEAVANGAEPEESVAAADPTLGAHEK